MGQRGRPRKSIEELVASGAILKNPKRYKHRMHELRKGPVKLKPPAHFCSSYAKDKLETWNELLEIAGEHLEPQDKFFLERLVTSIHEARYDTRPAVKKICDDLLSQFEERIRRRKASGAAPAASEGGQFGEFGI